MSDPLFAFLLYEYWFLFFVRNPCLPCHYVVHIDHRTVQARQGRRCISGYIEDPNAYKDPICNAVSNYLRISNGVGGAAGDGFAFLARA